MTSVIIGTPDANLASDISGILDEQGDFEVQAVSETTDALLERTADAGPLLVIVEDADALAGDMVALFNEHCEVPAG